MAAQDDPTAGIMDLMKDMYDSGDDQMKKTIGEAMMKSQQERMSGSTSLIGLVVVQSCRTVPPVW